MKQFVIFAIMASSILMCNSASVERSESELEPLDNIFTEIHLPKKVPKLGLSPGELKVFAGHSFQLLKAKCSAIPDDTVTQLNKYVAKLISKADLSQAEPTSFHKELIDTISTCEKTKLTEEEKFQRKQEYFRDVFGPKSGVKHFFIADPKDSVEGLSPDQKKDYQRTHDGIGKEAATPPTVYYIEPEDGWSSFGPFNFFRNAFRVVRNFFYEIFGMEDEKVCCVNTGPVARVKRDADSDGNGDDDEVREDVVVGSKVQKERGDGAADKMNSNKFLDAEVISEKMEEASTADADDKTDGYVMTTKIIETFTDAEKMDKTSAATEKQESTTTKKVEETSTAGKKVDKSSVVGRKVEKAKVPSASHKVEKGNSPVVSNQGSGRKAFLELIDNLCRIFCSECHPSQIMNFKSAAKELAQLVFTDQSGLDLVSQHYLTPSFFHTLEEC